MSLWDESFGSAVAGFSREQDGKAKNEERKGKAGGNSASVGHLMGCNRLFLQWKKHFETTGSCGKERKRVVLHFISACVTVYRSNKLLTSCSIY